MSDQLPMFDLTNWPDTSNATSSPGSESGPTPCASPDGPTTAKCGPDRVLANPSVPPVKPRRSTTKGIFGQSGFHSSKHDDLSFVLANRLRPLTDSLGSTLFSLTWTVRVTPAGRSICALRASEPRTADSVCTGWPTPDASVAQNGESLESWQARREELRVKKMNGNGCGVPLTMAALMAAWPAPQSSDMTGGGQAKRSDGRANLNDFAMLAGWKTPCVPNGGRISGNKTDLGKHQDGTKAQIGLENEAKLSGWTTPTSTERSGQGPKNESLFQDARLTAWRTPNTRDHHLQGPRLDAPQRQICLPDEAQLTAFGQSPIGYLLGPNGWEIVPASGQLNAAHSRWLMGLPPVWDDCGVTGMASSRRSPKRS